MVVDIIQIVAGLALLAVGGEGLVRGAVGLALRFRVTPAVIGLTVVAAGTSMPELVVSVLASLQDKNAIAVANVVGSNIFNFGLVLGVTALILIIPVASSVLRLEWPFLLVITLGSWGVMANRVITRWEGVVMIAVLVLFLMYMVRRARSSPADVELEESVPHGALSWVFLMAGIAMLIYGAKLIVQGASDIALTVGVSERIVGLTIVAMGTSLPELASSLVAAMRGRSDVAVGNVIGSCIFNLLGILGITAAVSPLGVDPELFSRDMPWMLAFTVLVGPLLFFGKRLTRIDGLILTVGFAVYMFLLGAQT